MGSRVKSLRFQLDVVKFRIHALNNRMTTTSVMAVIVVVTIMALWR